jgi:thiosulfate/3-mercaptopyruvate sulfurtransferase
MDEFTMRYRFLSLLLFGLVLTGCAQEDTSPPVAGNPTASTSSVLIDPEWIAMNSDKPEVIIIDIADSEEAYLGGHIPGARYLDWRVDISDPAQAKTFNLLPRAQFEALMSRLGVNNDTTLVLYDAASSRLAARVYWTLKYYGHDDIRILDGGRDAWERSGLGFSGEIPPVGITDYQVMHINEKYLADMDFINNQIRNPGFTLVDARAGTQYTGEQSGRVFSSGIEHRNKGHIYGAQNVPWSDNFNEDGTFKSFDELRNLYAPHGVNSDKTVVTYCNVGIQGSSPWFVLSELLGYEDVRLYDASMAEWANDDENIMVMGKHCMQAGG